MITYYLMICFQLHDSLQETKNKKQGMKRRSDAAADRKVTLPSFYLSLYNPAVMWCSSLQGSYYNVGLLLWTVDTGLVTDASVWKHILLQFDSRGRHFLISRLQKRIVLFPESILHSHIPPSWPWCVYTHMDLEPLSWSHTSDNSSAFVQFLLRVN